MPINPEAAILRAMRGGPSWRPSYGGGRNRLSDIFMYGGQQAADATLRQGDILAQTVTGVGQQIGAGLEKQAEEKKLKARDAAWLSVVNDPATYSDPRAAYAKALEVWGPQEGPKQFQAIVAVSQLTQKQRNPEADAKAFQSLGAAYLKLSPEGRAAIYPQLRAVGTGAYPEFQMPEQYDPKFDEQVVAPMVQAMQPKADAFTLSPGQARFEGDKKVAEVPPEPPKPPSLQHMETAEGIRTFNPQTGEVGPVIARPKPSAPREPVIREIQTVENGKTVTKFVEARPGATYESPAKTPPQQRLTKDERQDFAAWNYALPRIDAFSKYVQANPGKWGKLDAFRQEIKQAIPGLSDAEYASQDAFIARMNAEIRHALFGAALTEGENESAKAFMINREDQPEVVLAKIREATARARSSMDYYRQLGFSVPAAGAAKQPGALAPEDDALLKKYGY